MQLKKLPIVFILALFLNACSANTKIPNRQKENLNSNRNLVSRNSESTLIGIASFKEYESSKINQQKKNASRVSNKTNVYKNVVDKVKEYVTDSYPFDYVKIHSATKFTLYIPEENNNEDLDALKLASGLGNLEVIVSEFTTYIVDKEDYDKDGDVDELLPSVTDTLISFRGSNGFYTILCNSYALGNENNYENSHKYWVFSSHKVITSTYIEKNSEPPINCVLLEITDEGQYKISFKKNEDITSIREFFDYNHVTQYDVDTSTVEKVSRDTMYSIFELRFFPETEQIVQIVSIDVNAKSIKVKCDTVLSEVYFDDSTEYNKGSIELGELFNLLLVENYIKITYDNYFEGYNPTSVYVNSVTNIDIE